LPGHAIELGGYATMPSADGERTAVVRDLLRSIGASYLLDVPGFYKRNRAKDTRLAGTPGILIPVRDDAGLVVACLIRVDEARDGGGKYRWLSSPSDAIGCGPGLCIHVPLHNELSLDVVRVTEGPLKADIATVLSGILTLGLPGVGAWKLAVPTLRRLKPKRVLVAFDVDARTNPHVARPLARITNTLLEEGYEVAIELWPSSAGKGIDDVLAAGRASSIRIVEHAGIASELRAIQSGAGIEPTESQPRPGASGEPASTEERKSQAKALLELAAGADYFHSPDGKMFADVRVDGRRQTWAISSASFRQWLALRMYRTHDKPAGAQAMSDAIAVLEARARFVVQNALCSSASPRATAASTWTSRTMLGRRWRSRLAAGASFPSLLSGFGARTACAPFPDLSWAEAFTSCDRSSISNPTTIGRWPLRGFSVHCDRAAHIRWRFSKANKGPPNPQQRACCASSSIRTHRLSEQSHATFRS
jgi:hypothetical protein